MTPQPKPDLSETSPMDSKARADAEREARRDGPAAAGGHTANGAHPFSGGAGAIGGATDVGPVSGAEPSLDPPPSSTGAGSAAGRGKTKGGTNIDTIIGKIVVDQGLATPEEVQQCMEMARASSQDGNSKSLPILLVENDYITRRQLERIKAEAEAQRQGQQIPGYKILGELGKGAMATVFKAKQLSLDRLVAIKVLPRKFMTNPQFVERFYAEGRAAAALNHPNIVQAYDVGQAGDYHYFVMEYVEGRTVYDDIVRHKRYNEVEAIDVVIQTAEALLHAHQKGLIHRDVKPKNIMINKEGVAKLADMGLARAMSDKEAAEAEAGKAFGTPYYISPEQIRGEITIGPPSDIYSLGATLYHMLTGAVPFDGKNPSAVMHKHLKGELVPPDRVNPRLSAGISEIIEMMMSKNPRDRYQTCADLLVDLRAVRAGKNPPIAHKDISGAELAGLAQAEAAAAAQSPLPALPLPPGATVSRNLFIVMVALLVISVVVNLVLIVS
ncbi:MAG: serine/threonine-protein kinase [Phycisphaerales bacterium]